MQSCATEVEFLSPKQRGKPDGNAPGERTDSVGAHVRFDRPEDDWNFPFEAELHSVAPGLHEAQNAWLAQIDSLAAPDRKTHELIRMVCTVILRNPLGVARHAMLAAEVGATWEDIAGSILLTEPAFGLVQVVEALPWARRGYERGAQDAKNRKPA